VQANWVAILYPGAALAAAAYAPRGRGVAAGLGIALTAALYLQASLAALPLPAALDPTARLAGFDDLAAEAAQVARDNQIGALGSEEYGLAALLAWHGTLPVAGNEPRWRFFGLPAAPPGPLLLVLSARHTDGPNPALWRSRSAASGGAGTGR
jgi:hypothetical protein